MRARTACLALLFSGICAAQERFGIAHSNFGGNDAYYLNPARAAGQWPYLDIRFVGADLNVWNSMVAWSDRERPLVGEVRNGMAGQTNGNVVLRENDFFKTQRAFVQANALGPAVSLSLGRGTIGVGMRSRAYVSATGINSDLATFLYQGFDYSPQHGTPYKDKGTKLMGAAWSEVGLSYAHILKAEGFSMLSAGASLHYNMGHAGAAFQISDLDYTVNDTSLSIARTTARYGYAAPASNAGSGWGGDLGMTYERTMADVSGYRPHQGTNGCSPIAYRYRIGISLIDLGGIRFRNAEAGSINSGAMHIADYRAMGVNNGSDLDSLMSTATNWSRSSAFKVGLPTAISLQYDQRIVNNTYFGTAIVQQLAGRNSLRLRRTNSMAITPRYETRYVEAALPIVFNEYDLAHPSVGLMLRVHGLVVGSDRIMPFLNKRDVYALDFYVRLRYLIFNSPKCRGKKGRIASSISTRNGNKGMVPCVEPNGR